MSLVDSDEYELSSVATNDNSDVEWINPLEDGGIVPQGDGVEVADIAWPQPIFTCSDETCYCGECD